MRTSRSAFAVVLLTVTAFASSQAAADLRFWRSKKKQPPAATKKQEPPAPKYLVRARSQVVTSAVHRDNCVVVYPDGRFHMEQSDQKKKSARPRVYDSTLSPAQMEHLRQVVGQPALVNLGNYLKARAAEGYRVEILEATIPRPTRTQAVALTRSDGKPPLPLELKPLSNWLGARFDSTNLKPSANATANGCTVMP